MSSPPKVLIVGAGPAGLTLAISLILNGIPVRLIDRLATYHGGARGTALQPRTQELLLALGVLHEIRAHATPPLQMRAYAPDGKTVVKTWDWTAKLEPDPSRPFLEPITCSQAMSESVLRAKLEELGGRVELGAELVGIEQLPDTVKTAVLVQNQQTETISVDWVVGTDGARGVVRKFTGINFLGETREGELSLAANVEAIGIDQDHWHMWGSFSTAWVGLKPLGSPNMFQLQTGGPEANVSAVRDLESLKSHFARLSGNNNIVIKDASWISEYKPNVRMADRFRHGRVFIAGDAAHCHPPTGGQGLNTSMMDSANLAWKLALVIKGLSPPSLLDTYDSERLPVVATMLNLASKLHVDAFAAKPKSTEEKGASWGKDAMWRPTNLLMLGINHKWSPIVFDDRISVGVPDGDDPYESAGVLRAGDRAPNAPGIIIDGGAKSVLFDFFSPTRHTLILFAGRGFLTSRLGSLDRYHELGVLKTLLITPESGIASSRYVHNVVDHDGDAHAVYGVTQGGMALVIVRPDGFIGAYVHTFEGAQKYFSAVLSA